jgi:hypothetical protein
MDIMEALGVKISMPKRVLPRTLEGVEFASKFLTREGDLSPLPLGCLYTKTPLSMFTLWDAIWGKSQISDAMSALSHAPDFRKSFPLGQGPSGHEDLATL